MIRLIPLLAAIAVLLWQPTEGWSDESDTLLEPDAVLQPDAILEGSVIWESTKYHTEPEKYCVLNSPLNIQLKDYKFNKWVNLEGICTNSLGSIINNGNNNKINFCIITSNKTILPLDNYLI